VRSMCIAAEGPTDSPVDLSAGVVDSGSRIVMKSWGWLVQAEEGEGKTWDRGEVLFGAPGSRRSVGLRTGPYVYSYHPPRKAHAL